MICIYIAAGGNGIQAIPDDEKYNLQKRCPSATQVALKPQWSNTRGAFFNQTSSDQCCFC
jgi:hypothetical protein